MLKRICVVALLCLAAFGQEGPAVNQSAGPPPTGWTELYFYDGSSNLEYVCKARTAQPAAALSVTQIVDSTNTGTVTTSASHGLAVGNRVVIAGVTVDTDLNGTYAVASIVDDDEFTITTASVSDATYNNAGITATTTAPRTTRSIWSIRKYSYSGSDLVRVQWAVTPGNSAAESTSRNICDNRAALAFN